MEPNGIRGGPVKLEDSKNVTLLDLSSNTWNYKVIDFRTIEDLGSRIGY